MPKPRTWPSQDDETIRTMRAAGETWAAIGRYLGLSRNTVFDRGRRLGKKTGAHDPNRGPLPAGHELTWGIICPAKWPGYVSDRAILKVAA